MTKMYLGQSVWGFLIETCAGMSLAYSILSCFYVDPQIQHGPVPAIIVAACMLAMFLCAINRRIMRIGIPLYAIAIVASWICAASLSEGSAFADVETNAMIYVMASTLSATATFLLARTRIGSAILFMAGILILAIIQFLYEGYDLAWLVIFVVASLAIVIYRNFLSSVQGADSVRSANFLAGFIVALVTSCASVGIGAAAWFGVIAPMAPDAFQIKLVTETRSLEMVLAKGTSSVYMTPDTSLTSDITNDDIRTTDDAKEDPGGTPTPANGVDTSGNTKNPNNAGSFLGENIDSLEDMFDLANYDFRTYALLALAIALIAGIVMYFIFRRQNRMFKLMWMQKLGAYAEAPILYKSIMRKLKRLGIEPAPGQTLTDFAKANEEHMRYFNEASKESFREITEAYVRSVYGAAPFDANDIYKMERFYTSFWKGAFKHLGPIKYFFKSFRL